MYPQYQTHPQSIFLLPLLIKELSPWQLAAWEHSACHLGTGLHPAQVFALESAFHDGEGRAGGA